MKKCRACSSNNLSLIMEYGNLPLSNGLLCTYNPLIEEYYPLSLYFCNDCFLVQIIETIDPKLLFQDYAYFSSCSDTILNNAKSLTEKIMKKYNPQTVVEIASNDGYLLQYYPKDITVVGVDPAENIAKIAEEKGIRTIVDFFGTKVSKKMKQEFPKIDIIHANNVLAHVSDINDFLDGIYNLLDDNGIFIVEVPYLADMIDNVYFDTVYHEHLCYFSVTALDNLLSEHKLYIIDFDRLECHGGSIRFYISKHFNNQIKIYDIEKEEEKKGIQEFGDYYKSFSEKAKRIKNDLQSLFEALNNKTIAGVGASAKGNILLNYCDISVDYIGDNIIRKQGLFTPGKHIPIISMEEMLERNPDYILILAWNHAEEIMNKLSEYKGKFIIPLPEVRIIN